MKMPRWKGALWGAMLIVALLPVLGFAESKSQGVGPAAASAQVSYQFRTFTVPGTRSAIPLKLNDEYDVVGYADFSTGTQGFLYNLESGGLEEIAVPGACLTLPAGLNNRDHVVGTYYTGPCDEPGEAHAFFRDADGIFYTIDILTGQYTAPEGVNDKGAVSGSVVVSGAQRGFIMQCAKKKGAFVCTAPTIFDAPGVGTFLTRASDITKKGDTVGEFLDHPESNRQHGFLRDKQGRYTTIDYPGALGSSLSGLNNHAVVGFWYTNEPGTHSLLFNGKKFFTIDPVSLGAVSSNATDINKEDVIVGIYSDANGGAHGYVATPQ